MRTAVLVVGVGCVVAAGGLATGDAPDNLAEMQEEMAELKKHISSLEGRVESLEKQLKKGSIVIVDTPGRPDDESLRAPRQFRWPEYRPKGWQRRQFNGIPYYVIPLCRDSAKPGSPAK
ncbi:MAG: hypothetical protein JSU70_13895 [Phycisphaerales bacterium]|nr:MAG: hypothetical protein JSU70_13895 [Phycisphaerales bacterium]